MVLSLPMDNHMPQTCAHGIEDLEMSKIHIENYLKCCLEVGKKKLKTCDAIIAVTRVLNYAQSLAMETIIRTRL